MQQLWTCFTDTGDPLAYLLYRAAERIGERDGGSRP